MPSRARSIVASYPELVAVLAAAILGLSVQRPLAWLADHQGINVLLAILVRISHSARRPFRTKPRNTSPIAGANTEVIERV